MREGLRSGKLRVRPKRDEILSEKKAEVENPGDKINDVNLDGGEAQVLWVGDKEAVVPPEPGREDAGAGKDIVSKVNFDDPDLREQGESEFGESESKKQSMREDCCDPKATSGAMAKGVAVDDLDGAEPFSRHVLRSMTISGGGSEKREWEEDQIVSSKVKKKRGRPPKIEKAGVDENGKDEIISAKVKKKRGRRPKIKEAKIDESEKKESTSTEVKKRGRPLKFKEAEVDENEKDEIISAKVMQKRGRPPKIKEAEIDESEKEEIASTDVKKKRERLLKFKEAEIDESEKEEITSTEVKKKRGRPPKIKKKKVDENDKEEIASTEVKKERGQAPTIITAEVGENKEDEIISTGVKKTRGWPPKIRKAEIDENKKDKQLSDNQVPRKLRRKRGRPCKSEISMIEGENGYVSNENQSKKRGRPPKEGASTDMPATKPLMAGNVHGGRRNHRFLRVKRSWKKLVGKALNRGKRGKKGKLMRHMINRREGNVILENGEGNEESNIREGSRREEKQLVKDKIMKLILGAGWTVQYKPREGRGYQDAIYVSPYGRAYWSITLAYKVLKRHYEEGNGESSAYTKGFVFNPITNEEIRILARITEKKIKDMGRKDGEVDPAIKKKKLRGKRNSVTTSFGGPVCAKVRGETSLDRESLLSSGNRRRPETENNKRRGLLVRKTGENESGEENYILYKGKRTVLAWIIDMGVVPNNGVVLYRQRKTSQTDLDGWFTKDGIRCSCCDEVVTITEFEAHAGHEGWNMALQNILLDNKISLLQCELTSWNKQEESVKKGFYYIDTKGDDPNDDTCGICGDGGNLVCCESCPSTFHLCCLGIKKSPSGDWHCPYCSCKYCGMVAVSTGERTNDGDTAISALNKCLLCEEKFHRLCVLAEDAIEDAWASRSFCGKKCLKLHKDIEGLLGVERKLEEGYSCTLVRRSDIDFGITTFDKLSQKVHSNSKVAVALSIMDECFLPVDDRRSGINLIHNILYNCGSNFNRLDFSGFYTAILEKGDEMISVASIRIHGNQFAEMPFIGTRYMYRRQGMCRRLLTALESILCTLKVEKLVIPAIDELKETWTSVFGFEPVRGELRKRMRNMKVLAFPGVDMLQKQLSAPPALVENVISIEGPFSTRDKDMNKDGSDITNDGIQFSDSENGKNQIIQSDEPSDTEEKCGNIMDPLPDVRESPQDLSACLNLDTPGADVELDEKTSIDVGIIPCIEPCRSDVEDEESLVISISNGGSKNLACDRGTKSRLSEVFSENVLDDKEGLALGNESLSPGEPFHDAEEEILAGTESPPDHEGELPSSECKTEHPLHQAMASNGPCNPAPSASPGDFVNEALPLQDIIVGSGQVLVANSNHVPSAEEGTKSGLSGEFLENVLDGNEGLAPVNGSPSRNELFYDAKEETLTPPGSPPNSNEKLPSHEFKSDKTLRQPTDSSGHCNQVPPAAPGEVSPFQNKHIQDIMDSSTRVVPVDLTMNPGEVADIPKLDVFEDK